MKRTVFLFVLVLAWVLGTFLALEVESAFAGPTSGTQVHLPVLTWLGDEADACDVVIEVQNVGSNFTKAAILFWGAPGVCPPAWECNGPFLVECSGLLKPGSAWNFMGPAPVHGAPQVPPGARSGVVFSLSTDQQAGATFADAVCEDLFVAVRADCDEYLSFKQAFDEGGVWRGFDLGAHSGEPLAVEVVRKCQTATMDAPVVSDYSGVAGEMLGAWNPVEGGFAYHVPRVYGDVDGFNSWIYIHNAGLACTSVDLVFAEEQSDCQSTPITDEIPALAPGESIAYAVSDAVGSGWQGNVLVQTSEPVAVVVDNWSVESLTTYQGTPAELNFTFDPNMAFFTVGSQVNYAPLTYPDDEGWDTLVTVQNLSAMSATTITIEFLDTAGTLVETQTAEGVCPRGTVTFERPVTDGLPGYDVGWVQISSTDANVIGQVNLQRWDGPAQRVFLESLSYPTLPAWQVEGVSRTFLPGGGNNNVTGGGETGLISEIALVNFNRTPGVTDFRIDLYAHNRVQHSLYYTLAAGQMTYVEIVDQNLVEDGALAGVVVEVESTTQGSPAFGAVGVSRFNWPRVPTTDPGYDAPGDQTAAGTAWPDMGTFAPVAPDECPAAPPPVGTETTEVFIPALQTNGSSDDTDVILEVQNVGQNTTKAMVFYWGWPGACAPQCNGPFFVECSGLLKPGSTWVFSSSVPSGAVSAAVFSLSTEFAAGLGGVFADKVCDRAFGWVRSDCDEYRRFKQAFEDRGQWTAGGDTFDFSTYQGEPLAVVVNRDYQAPAMAVPVAAAYRGLAPVDLGQPAPGCSFEYEVAPLYAGQGDLNTRLIVQNAGDECTGVQLRFRTRDECLRTTDVNVSSLAPGESYFFDVNTLFGPFWVGSVQMIASQPLAVVADTLSGSIFDATTAQPAPSPDLGFQPYRPTAYGPLFYRETHGWDSQISVFNLDQDRTAPVRVTFLDETGAEIASESAPVCPRGMRNFDLPASDTQAGRAVGAVLVTAEGDAPPPVAAVAELTKSDGSSSLTYTLFPATQAEGVEQIALPTLSKGSGSNWTSEIIATNWNTATGSTNLALDLYDQNGLFDTLNKTIGPGQTLRINLADESGLIAGWTGSAVLRSIGSSQAGGPSLSAVVAEFAGGSGDLARVYEGQPLDPAPPTPTTTPPPSPTPEPNPPEVAGPRAYVPALRTIGDQTTDASGWIEVQNVGSQNVVAVLTYWGTGGDCASPQQGSQLSGLLPPGAGWRWTTADLPQWAQSARVEAYTDTPSNGGVPIDIPLAVAVGRSAPSPDEGIARPLSTGYIAVPQSGLGVPDGNGQYELIVPGVYAGWQGLGTSLNIQNAGDACADVTLEFKRQDGECLSFTTCQLTGLAPGETRVFDAGSCVSTYWLGSVQILSTQPLAVVADTALGSVASSQVAAPANVPDAGFAPNSTTAYGAINFAAEHGWNSEVFVHSLASRRIGQIRASFLDPRGAILKGLNDLICPQGQADFPQWVIDGRPGEQLQAIEVRADGPDPVPIVAAAQATHFEGPAQTQVLSQTGYGLVSSRLISGTDAIALPWLARGYGDSTLPITTPLTSQVAIANWNHTAGNSEVALDLLGDGCVRKTITRTLAAGQLVGINLADETDMPAGWRGSGIVRLVQTTQTGGMRLSAAVADRTGQPETGPVAVYEGVPLFGSYDFGSVPTCCLLAGDLDWNGQVDGVDVQHVAAAWRDSPPDNPRYDQDGDGTVTVKDIMEVVAQWGDTCP